MTTSRVCGTKPLCLCYVFERFGAEMRNIHVKIDDETAERLKAYADESCSGNVSRAVRALLARSLDQDLAARAIEKRIDEAFDEKIERMLKIQSRGTKAALANLYLASAYLPVIADAVEASGRGVSALARHTGSRSCDEAIDAALYPVAHLSGAGTKDVFDAALRAGGNLQQQKGALDYFSAHRAASPKEAADGR